MELLGNELKLNKEQVNGVTITEPTTLSSRLSIEGFSSFNVYNFYLFSNSLILNKYY